MGVPGRLLPLRDHADGPVLPLPRPGLRIEMHVDARLHELEYGSVTGVNFQCLTVVAFP